MDFYFFCLVLLVGAKCGALKLALAPTFNPNCKHFGAQIAPNLEPNCLYLSISI